MGAVGDFLFNYTSIKFIKVRNAKLAVMHKILMLGILACK